jgi:putative ABC transport system ATP-binding protein
MALLSRYSAAGQTIVLVTHNHIVASVADRVLHMRDGMIADETRVDAGGGATAILSRMLALEA